MFSEEKQNPRALLIILVSQPAGNTVSEFFHLPSIYSNKSIIGSIADNQERQTPQKRDSDFQLSKWKGFLINSCLTIDSPRENLGDPCVFCAQPTLITSEIFISYNMTFCSLSTNALLPFETAGPIGYYAFSVKISFPATTGLFKKIYLVLTLVASTISEQSIYVRRRFRAIWPTLFIETWLPVCILAWIIT